MAFGRGHARALPRHDGAPVARAAVKGRAFLVVVSLFDGRRYGLLMITTIGYVAGSLSQASLNVNSAAGFFGPADKVRAGAARKVFSLTALSAARRRTPAAARLILAASTFEVFSGAQRACLALRRLDFSSSSRPRFPSGERR